jgi:predicted acylesterase/phospholipase RssA
MFKLRPSIAKEQVGGLLTLSPKIISELSRGNMSSLLQLKWLKTTGLFTTKGIEQYLRDLLPSNEFKDYGADLFINTTPLNHPAKIVFGKYPRRPMKLGPVDPHCRYRNHATISEACAASMSVPILYAPYPIKSPDGQTMHYIDGEVRDTLSAHVAAEAGADLVIASYTHQPYALLKDVGSLTAHGLPSIVVQTIYLMIEQKIRTQIRTEQKHRSAINEVAKFCKANGLNRKTTTALCELLEHELGHKMSVDTIYIHPSPKDGEIFFNEHFSLSMQNLTKLVDCGFNATTETLRHYRFSGLNGEDNV